MRILFALLLLPARALAADPVGIVLIPHDAHIADGAFAEFPVVGYRGENPDAELLVWGKTGDGAKARYAVRDAKGSPSWIQPRTSRYAVLETRLMKDSGVVLPVNRWDGKVYATAGGPRFTAVSAPLPADPLPPELQFESELVMPPMSCHSTGTVTDRQGAQWQAESCEPGRPLVV